MKNSFPKYSAFLVILVLGGCLESEPPRLYERDLETIAGLEGMYEVTIESRVKGTQSQEGAFFSITAMPDKSYRIEMWAVGEDDYREKAEDSKNFVFIKIGPSTFLTWQPVNEKSKNIFYIEMSIDRTYLSLFGQVDTAAFRILELPKTEFDDPSVHSFLGRHGFTIKEKNVFLGDVISYELIGRTTSSGLKRLFSNQAFDRLLDKTSMVISFQRADEDAFLGNPRPTAEATGSGGAEVEKSRDRKNDEYTKALEEKNRQLQKQLETQRQAEIRKQQELERQRVCGAWHCVKLEDGTVLFRTKDGSAWIYRDGTLAPEKIWPKR